MNLTILAQITLAATFAPAARAQPAISIYEMPIAQNLDHVALAPVLQAIGGAEVVLLGEAIHLTSEFSVARSRLIQALHSEKNFRSVYFEGSPVEFWIAQEEFLDSARVAADFIAFQKSALFFLWQTKEIAELVQYALKTQSLDPAQWLYLSSYDVQIGQGFGFMKGRSIFGELTAKLLKRGFPLPTSLQESLSRLSSLAQCKRRGFPSEPEYQQARQTIAELERIIAGALPSDGNNPHEKMLALLPQTLGFSLEFCREAKLSVENYTQIRDSWAARQFLFLNSALPQKSAVWAHSGHIISTPRSNSLKNFGYFFRQARPVGLYSIHFTAIEGKAVNFSDGKGNEIEPEETEILPAEKLSFETKLQQLSRSDFFLQLRPEQNLFASVEESRLEPLSRMQITPLESYDAYYVIQKIQPPRLLEY